MNAAGVSHSPRRLLRDGAAPVPALLLAGRSATGRGKRAQALSFAMRAIGPFRHLSRWGAWGPMGLARSETFIVMNLLDILNAPWAIQPEKLVEIRDIYLARVRGERPDLAAIEAKLGREVADFEAKVGRSEEPESTRTK